MVGAMKSAFKRAHRSQAGFTLVELLVVVAILGVLIAVVVPNFATLFGRGQYEATKADRNTVQVAVDAAIDRKSTRLNSSHIQKSRMPSSA